MKVGDEGADGLWTSEKGQALPWHCSTRCGSISLRRLLHYTGTDWRGIQPWILLTNYQRYVDQFVRWGMDEAGEFRQPYDRLIAPGGASPAAATTWRRPRRDRDRAMAPFQMPAYHLGRSDGQGGVRSSTSASGHRTPRTSRTTWRCCGRIAG